MQYQIHPELAFLEVEKMLHDLAWKASRRYSIDEEETRSQAYYGFMEAVRRYDPARGAQFSSYCYSKVNWLLKDLAMAKAKNPAFLEVTERLAGAAPATRSPSLEIVEELSEDAREIVSLLIETPAELLGETPVPIKQLLTRVKTYLRFHRGRDGRKLDAACREIRQALREAWA